MSDAPTRSLKADTSGVPSRGELLGPRHGLVGDDSDEVVSGVQLIIATTITGMQNGCSRRFYETEYTFGRRDDATGGQASTGAVFPRARMGEAWEVPSVKKSRALRAHG